MLRLTLSIALIGLVSFSSHASEQAKDVQLAQATEPASENGDLGDQARTALERGEFEKAIQLTTQAIESGELSGDDLITAHIYRANAYAAMGRTTDAVADINATLELRPNDPELVNLRGDFYLNSGEFPAAIENYNQSISLKPDFWEAYLDRGFAHAMLEDFDSALADTSKAVEINPNEYTYASRGDLYLAQDKFDEAIGDFTDALSLGQISNIGAYLGRAEAYFSKERYEDALADYNSADQMSPDDAVVLYLRGTTYEKLSDNDKARADLERAGELDPEYTDVQEALERVTPKE